MPDGTPQPVLDYASPGAMGPRLYRSMWGWVVFIALAIMLFLMVKNKGLQYTPISFSQFMDELQKGHMSEITIEKDGVRGTLTLSALTTPGGLPIKNFHVNGPDAAAGNWQFIEFVNNHRGSAEVSLDLNGNALMDVLVPLIPWLLIFGFLWFFLRQARKGQAACPRPIPVYQVAAPVQQSISSL